MTASDSVADCIVSKAVLRRALLADRERFAEGAPRIAPPAAFLQRLHSPGIIASYAPMPGEADPSLLAEAARECDHRIALPHVTTRAAPMRFLLWSPGDPLVPGPFGLMQPVSDAPEAVPDIVLTPLIGFDALLNRLGHGAGYYDRAFATLPTVLRIGVAWSIQRVPALPTDPWDVPLNGVITEHGWIDPETDQ